MAIENYDVYWVNNRHCYKYTCVDVAILYLIYIVFLLKVYNYLCDGYKCPNNKCVDLTGKVTCGTRPEQLHEVVMEHYVLGPLVHSTVQENNIQYTYMRGRHSFYKQIQYVNNFYNQV